MKTCKKCGETKPLTAFRKHPNNKDGLSGECKKCFNEYKQAWRQANRDKQIAQNLRERLKPYGLSLEEYQVLVEDHDGQCPICHIRGEELHIDHDHDTGAVRGLLCGPCNRAIGLLRDDPDTILRARSYLLKAQDKLKVAKG